MKMHEELKPAHLLEGEGGFIAVLITEVIVHPEVRLSAQLVSGLTVWDALDHSTLRESVNKEYEHKITHLAPCLQSFDHHSN